MNESKLIVAVVDGDGNIKFQQPYEDFMNGNRNINIINIYTGQKLFDILVDELGVIRYEDNKFALKTILESSNMVNTAMRILGKVAEAVIVRRCHENSDINKKWLSIARRKNAKQDTSNKFKAYGTGLLSTKNYFEKLYNNSDPQRDIIWADEKGQIALMNGSNSIAGTQAGLQIKVSKNGLPYIFNDLINNRYEVPLVYFDICNDFDFIAQKLYLVRNKNQESNIIIGKDFIKASMIDYNAYNEVLFYVDLIEALIYGKITPVELINSSDVERNVTLKNAILSTTLSNVSVPNKIG